MGQYTYYCEVKRGRGDYEPGVYKVVADRGWNHAWFPTLNRLITVSERVWKQGPRGGVKMLKAPSWDYPMGYITTNDEWMRKFAWVKLKAKTVSV